MVVFQHLVEGKDQRIYMDGGLYKFIKEKIVINQLKKDNDAFGVIDGGEGSGKSVLAFQIACCADPSFDLSRVVFSPTDFTKAVLAARKGQAIVFDEAFTGLSSRQSLSEINRLLLALMMEMRQKNLFVLIVMPNFWLLDRYVAQHRAKFLIHTYVKNQKKGQWVFFGNKKKNLLYMLGKKTYNYHIVKSYVRGRFFEQYAVNEMKYRKLKKIALMNKSRSTRLETVIKQRNSLIWWLKTIDKYTYPELEAIFDVIGIDMDKRGIKEVFDAISQKKRRDEELESG